MKIRIQLKQLDNLQDDMMVSGWKLLVKMGATQPALLTPTFILLLT